MDKIRASITKMLDLAQGIIRQQAEMLDVYYAAGRLTDVEYTELMGMLTPAE